MNIIDDSLFVGVQWIQPCGDGRITERSSTTAEPLRSVPDGTTADLDRVAQAVYRGPQSIYLPHRSCAA